MSQIVKYAKPILYCSLMAGTVNSAFAEQSLPVWELGLGPALLSFPDYPGSNEQNMLVLPFPHIVYRGENFQINQRELIKPLFKRSNVELSLSVSGSIPVSSKDNKAREGMDNLDGSIGVGPVIKYRFFKHGLNNMQFELPVRAVIASDFKTIHQEGWVVNPTLYYFHRKEFSRHQRLKLSMGVSANFATAENNNYFYGVPIEDERPGREAYRARGGFLGMGYILGLNVHVDRFWLGGFWRGHDMSQAVFKDSPLLETHFSHTFGLMLTWNFFQSKETVTGLDD
ncbi:MAG: MipA/OmpV family protein [Thiomicrorhabdus sp.]|nr:MipA/OmpV family protein [Thiomicrorhabdus sp.]